jgi:hypothetical protein
MVGFQTSSLKPKAQPSIKPVNTSRTRKRKLFDWMKAVKDTNDSFGIGRIEWDAINGTSWGLAATGGSYTQLHLDASGHNTWVKCLLGVKLWGYAVHVDSFELVQEAVARHHQILSQLQHPQNLSEFAKSANVILTPGTIL